LGSAVLENLEGFAARAARKLLGEVNVAAPGVKPVVGTASPEGRLIEQRQVLEISGDPLMIDVDS
jgi:hypothetical protein